jgi:hypothetical protein
MCGICLSVTAVTKYMYKSQIPDCGSSAKVIFFAYVMNAKI